MIAAANPIDTRTSPATRQIAARSGRAGPAVGKDAHRLRWFERGHDQRPPKAFGHPDLAIGGAARHADRDRVLDRGDLFDPQPHRRVGREVAGPVLHVRRRPDGFAADDDQPAVQRVGVDPDLVQALADLEGDRLAVVLECGPARRTRALLEAGAPVDERTMRVVLEWLLGVDPAVDRDVARARRPRAGAPPRP